MHPLYEERDLIGQDFVRARELRGEVTNGARKIIERRNQIGRMLLSAFLTVVRAGVGLKGAQRRQYETDADGFDRWSQAVVE